MQPDPDGFITVKWPSKNVPHGGIFHPHIANPTHDQLQLLKVQLEESKLSLEQYNKKALEIRQNKAKKQEQPIPRMPRIRPRTSRRRSLSEIRQSGVFEVEGYRPLKRGEDRERMKEKLAHTMTYGDSEELSKSSVAPSVKTEVKLPTKKDQWNDLVSQIRERTEWLAEMEYLGQAAPHRDIIRDQIAERMRALDELGIDIECSTARSSGSGFSTMRSIEKDISSSAGSVKSSNAGGDHVALDKKRASANSVHSSIRSNKSVKKQSVRGSVRSGGPPKDENVTAYAQFSPLQLTPRRRQ